VTPRAGVDAIEGVGPDGDMRLRVRAAPADGEANKAVIALIARAVDVPPSTVRIDRGATGRLKRIVIEEVETGELERRWPGLLTRQG
jgi:uncharacterized protein